MDALDLEVLSGRLQRIAEALEMSVLQKEFEVYANRHNDADRERITQRIKVLRERILER
jgi:hypothetical protein